MSRSRSVKIAYRDTRRDGYAKISIYIYTLWWNVGDAFYRDRAEKSHPLRFGSLVITDEIPKNRRRYDFWLTRDSRINFRPGDRLDKMLNNFSYEHKN